MRPTNSMQANPKRIFSVAAVATLLAAGFVAADSIRPAQGAVDFESWDWAEIKPSDRFDGSWAPRAGLQVVNLRNRLYLMGGRTPNPPSFPPIPGDSFIWGDVWTSQDLGRTWTKILDTETPGHWPARAYFEAVRKDSRIFVLGGQNFKAGPADCPPTVGLCSDFFNDVWVSRNGIEWEQLTPAADWEPRAGLSSVVFKGEIYVLGGSLGDDSAIGDPPAPRTYFDDVWKSRDGVNWEQVTDHAPWAPRAGGVAVVKNGRIFLLGGEAGFLGPYFNDVWSTRDGYNWDLVTPSAEWSPRPGHKCSVVLNHIVCFGGFGLPENPQDVWVSKRGRTWTRVSESPWNSSSSDDIKYDFDVLTIKGGKRGQRPAIFTFGGDRETFDFSDPTNYLRVDNDVWRYSPPSR